MTLTEFLLARIAEDEKAINEWGTEHQSDGWEPDGWELFDSDEYNRVNMSHGRALAECEAKRQIITEHAVEETSGPPGKGFGFACVLCMSAGDWGLPGNGYCMTLKALVLPYATHPDFDPAWSVTAAS